MFNYVPITGKHGSQQMTDLAAVRSSASWRRLERAYCSHLLVAMTLVAILQKLGVLFSITSSHFHLSCSCAMHASLLVPVMVIAELMIYNSIQISWISKIL